MTASAKPFTAPTVDRDSQGPHVLKLHTDDRKPAMKSRVQETIRKPRTNEESKAKQIRRRSRRPLVKEALQTVREWARDQVPCAVHNDRDEQLLYERAARLHAGDIWEAARLASDANLYLAKALFERNDAAYGVRHLYIDLIQYLLTHGIVLDSSYHELHPVIADCDGQIDATTEQRQLRHRQAMSFALSRHRPVGAWIGRNVLADAQ